MNRLAFIIFLILGFSCSDSSSVDNSVMIFEVTTLNNRPFDEFASNHEESYYPITITLIEYEPESEFSGTVNLNTIGTLSIAGNCSGKNDCFVVHLDSSFFPVEFLIYTNLKIDNSKMSGNLSPGGALIDLLLPPFTFNASRKE